jgi:hypothetical protein
MALSKGEPSTRKGKVIIGVGQVSDPGFNRKKANNLSTQIAGKGGLAGMKRSFVKTSRHEVA